MSVKCVYVCVGGGGALNLWIHDHGGCDECKVEGGCLRGPEV